MTCPYVPSAMRDIADVTTPDFDIVGFEDVSEKWTQVVRARSISYKASEKPNAALQIFMKPWPRYLKQAMWVGLE